VNREILVCELDPRTSATMAGTIDAIFNSFGRKLEPNVQSHLKAVYGCLTMTSLAAAAGAYVHIFTDFLSGFGIMAALAPLGLLIALTMTEDTGKNQTLRLGLLLGFGFATGLGMGPLLDMAISVDPAIVMTALLGTIVVFACFSACALFSERFTFIYLGGPLLSMLTAMSLMSLAALMFGSRMLMQVQIYLGVLLFSGFVLYDTQLIVEKRRAGDKDFIRHSVDLFLDFVALFKRIVIILTQKAAKERSNEKKRR